MTTTNNCQKSVHQQNFEYLQDVATILKCCSNKAVKYNTINTACKKKLHKQTNLNKLLNDLVEAELLKKHGLTPLYTTTPLAKIRLNKIQLLLQLTPETT